MPHLKFFQQHCSLVIDQQRGQHLQRSVLKVPMKLKVIAAYLKAFKTYSRMAFSFLAYLFSF